MSNNKLGTGLTLAVLSSATFGLVPLFSINLLHNGIAPNSLVFYRMAFGSAIMLFFLLIRRVNLKISFKEMMTVFLLSCLYAATSIFLTSSYRLVPSGIATVIHFLYPVVVALTLAIFFKERLSLALLIAIGLAISGVYLLCGGNNTSDISTKGVLMVLITVFTYGIYIVAVNKTRCRNVEGGVLTFYVLLFSSLILLIYNLVVERGHFDPITGINSWSNLLLLALIPTVLSNFFLILAIKHVGSNITAILGCMEPLTAVIVGISVFHEKLGFVQIIGGGVILAAVIIVLRYCSNNTAK